MLIRGNKLSVVGRDGVLRQLRLDATFKRCCDDMTHRTLHGCCACARAGPRKGHGTDGGYKGKDVWVVRLIRYERGMHGVMQCKEHVWLATRFGPELGKGQGVFEKSRLG